MCKKFEHFCIVKVAGLGENFVQPLEEFLAKQLVALRKYTKYTVTETCLAA